MTEKARCFFFVVDDTTFFFERGGACVLFAFLGFCMNWECLSAIWRESGEDAHLRLQTSCFSNWD